MHDAAVSGHAVDQTLTDQTPERFSHRQAADVELPRKGLLDETGATRAYPVDNLRTQRQSDSLLGRSRRWADFQTLHLMDNSASEYSSLERAPEAGRVDQP
ncbi:hypothetical protein GCM10009823_24830 [Brevibacterium salitolerans]|uniref:Uncharacterized protein n=1 Tax=Brevibacterium salitolerans TaxID=1403566 RepID=A0ABN2X0B2_9MICO